MAVLLGEGGVNIRTFWSGSAAHMSISDSKTVHLPPKRIVFLYTRFETELKIENDLCQPND